VGIAANGAVFARRLSRYEAHRHHQVVLIQEIFARSNFRATYIGDNSGLPSPVRSKETLLELIYEAHLKSGWLLAPYFQYVFRPSGGIPNPNDQRAARG
jgi:carbohydrate-selective porin OprB